jgi:serine/threonine protein kinase
MAPEVINCDTNRENPYDYKADIWSLGITCIELAEKEPPHHELNANRVLMKIRKSESPKLQDCIKWSLEFQDFVFKCLDKNPESRLTARELLKHPFITNTPNADSLKILLEKKIINNQADSVCLILEKIIFKKSFLYFV